MNPIELLSSYVRQKHPEVTRKLTRPLHKNGVWSLDLDLGTKKLTIEWSATSGFGVSSVSNEGYGERPDENFKSVEEVKVRVSRLLTSAEETSPPFGVLLSRLRERRGLTQEELGSKIGVKQATISGIERREDVQLSTLNRVIKALGGAMEIFAIFPEVRYRVAGRLVEEHDEVEDSANVSTIDDPDEVAFGALHESGELPRAKKVAHEISSRHAVLEMAD